MTGTLAGKRVLVVEDEPVVLMYLEDLLLDLGCVVAGTAATLAEGLALAERCEADAAILDINLHGERSDAIAARLALRGTPVLFATGYAPRDPPAGATLLIEKPYRPAQIEAALQTLIG